MNQQDFTPKLLFEFGSKNNEI